MGDLSLEKVSETYLDVLKEIGNIGAGNAMTALSQKMCIRDRVVVSYNEVESNVELQSVGMVTA